MGENRPAGGGRPQPNRKKPLKQRVAIAIVRAAERSEQKKAAKAKQKADPQPRPAQRRTPQSASAAPQGQRRLTPEQRKAQIRRLRRQRRTFRIAIGVIVVCVIFLILARTVLFKIQNIEVTNPETANYTTEQIIAQCGITYGTQNLFSCDLDKVAKNIEQRLPYIGKATVERAFPSALRVTVEPTKTSAAIAYGTGYLLIDADGKMLEFAETAPDKVPVLRCNTEFEQKLGEYIGKSAADKKADDKEKAAAAMIELYKRVDAGIRAAGIQDITLIDIRDKRAITLMYQNRLTLHLGDEEALETKLQTGAKTIAAENDGSKTRTGAIDLTTVPYAFARDTYEPASDVEETTEENTTNAAENEKNS